MVKNREKERKRNIQTEENKGRNKETEGVSETQDEKENVKI